MGRDSYTDAFKQKCLAEWAAGERPADIAERHGVGKSALYNWKSQFKFNKRKSPIIHEDSQVTLLKAKLRESLFAQYKAETGIDLSE
jgi:transposase-like protein